MSWSAVFHFSMVFILALLLAGLQTSFWFQIFGAITPPLLWLVVFTYLSIYRSGVPALFELMFLTLMLAAFSGINAKTFYSGLLIYFLVIYFVKSRIFWSGAGYFLLMCTLGSVVYHLVFFGLAMLMERSHADPMIIERLTQILLTPAFAFPIYWMMTAIDGIFIRREIKAEVTGGSVYE